MIKVLVPMDLTEVSVNAIRYAYDMFPEAEFHVIYVYSGQSTREPFYLKAGTSKEMILKEELINHIKAGLEVKTLPANVIVQLNKGEIVPKIREAALEFKPDYLVMGTRDKYDLFDKWIGTTSLGIVKSVDCPTFLVPKHATYQKMEKVLIATDHHLEDSALINWVKDWNNEFKAFVKFLHVQDSDNTDIHNVSDVIVNKLFQQDNVSFGFEITNIKSKEVTATLLSKAYNFGADLIMAAPDRQSLFNSLFYKSISKELIFKSKIPLLFLKFKEKGE